MMRGRVPLRRRVGGLGAILACAFLVAGCMAPRVVAAARLVPAQRVRVEALPLRIRDAADRGAWCAVSVVQGELEAVNGDTLILTAVERWAFPGAPRCAASSRIVVVLSESVGPRVLEWRPSPVRSFAAVALGVVGTVVIALFVFDPFQ